MINNRIEKQVYFFLKSYTTFLYMYKSVELDDVEIM